MFRRLRYSSIFGGWKGKGDSGDDYQANNGWMEGWMTLQAGKVAKVELSSLQNIFRLDYMATKKWVVPCKSCV